MPSIKMHPGKEICFQPMQRYGISSSWEGGGGKDRRGKYTKGNKNYDRKVGWGHESRGCHKIQLLSSLVTFSPSYKISFSMVS